MSSSRRGVAFTPMETRRDVIVRAAVLADELGYETFSVPEAWGLDSTPVLTEIGLRTARIRVASGILSVWGRTPATLAMTAATLHQVCAGREQLEPWDRAADIATILLPPGIPWGTVEATLRAAAPAT